jgi:hypothetical protein
MTAAEPKREDITIAVAVVSVKNEPEPHIAVSLGGETTILHLYDGMRLAHAVTTACEEVKKILDKKTSKAVLQ